MQILNLNLVKNPLNWAIIFFMLLIAAIAGHQLLALAKLEPAS